MRDVDEAAPGSAVDSVVVVVDARTATERDLVAAWARSAHPGAPLVDQDDPGLGSRLAGGGDPLVVPARVTWLPPDADGDGALSTAADLLKLASPRRPPAALHRRIASRSPHRARVTAGEPARALELRGSFTAETGGSAGNGAFAAFVARRAMLACDRAERRVIGERYKVPRLVAEQISASARFRARIAALADRLERPFPEVLAEAQDDLQELAAVQSPPAIDAFRAVMAPLHRRAWTVDEDVASLERLRELNRRHALVFLPSHRSYADPLVLADVLHRHDFPRNHVLGGINMAFWPIGPLGKRAGLIFIRRSFAGDEVYKLAVREYFGHLAAKRFNLEWYLEGGRTRTGKLRPPRYGLLHYLVSGFEDREVDDVILVPTSITYEQLQEVGAMAAEQGGAAKRREGLGWFVDYVRAQSRDAGIARVRFGEPLSLRQALADAGEGRAQMEKVAFQVCVGINRASPVTATSLVTFALLGVRDRALTLPQVVRIIAPLLDHLDARGIPGPLEDLRRPGAVRRTLVALEKAGVVASFDGGTEAVWSIAPDHHHVAAFYRNGALHHLVNRAVVELCLMRLAMQEAADDPLEEGWQEALRLRDLLKFEFFFTRKQRFQGEVTDELERLGWPRDRTGPSPRDAAGLLAQAPVLVAHGAVRSFLDAQLVVAGRLAARDPRQGLERDAFLAECLGSGRQLLLQGRLLGPETVSRDLFEGALRLAANRDLVDPGRDEVRAGREAWLAEVRDVLERLVRIGELDSARLEEVLDGDAR
jgi:glycerol-3-phosphate O-acyltransferase